MQWIAFAAIGLGAGLLSGLFGIGGGVLIVPALVYGLGFSQKMATGTSLAILLPPVGIAAVFQYYQAGSVNLKAAMVIALMLVFGSWIGAKNATGLNPAHLKTLFGGFLIVLGAYMVFDGLR